MNVERLRKIITYSESDREEFHVESSLKKSLNRMESRLFFKISDRYKELNNVLVAGTGQSAMIAPFFCIISWSVIQAMGACGRSPSH